jgi:peptidylprolyl isomerase
MVIPHRNLWHVRLYAGGRQPTPTDTVRVHYEGRLADGTVFDSSLQRGEPAEFSLGEVIAGWSEGLSHMTVGSKTVLTIPARLAYGSGGAGPIPPMASLIFTVELLAIR